MVETANRPLSDKERDRAGKIVEMLVSRLDSEGQTDNEYVSNVHLIRTNLAKLDLTFEKIFALAANNNGGVNAELQQKLNEALAENRQLKELETRAYSDVEQAEEQAQQTEAALKQMQVRSLAGLASIATDFVQDHVPGLSGAFGKVAKPIGWTVGGLAAIMGASWFLAGGAGVLPAIWGAAYAAAPCTAEGVAGGFFCLGSSIAITSVAVACIEKKPKALWGVPIGIVTSAVLGAAIGGGMDLAHYHRQPADHHRTAAPAPADSKRITPDSNGMYRVVLSERNGTYDTGECETLLPKDITKIRAEIHPGGTSYCIGAKAPAP